MPSSPPMLDYRSVEPLPQFLLKDEADEFLLHLPSPTDRRPLRRSQTSFIFWSIVCFFVVILPMARGMIEIFNRASIVTLIWPLVWGLIFIPVWFRALRRYLRAKIAVALPTVIHVTTNELRIDAPHTVKLQTSIFHRAEIADIGFCRGRLTSRRQRAELWTSLSHGKRRSESKK